MSNSGTDDDNSLSWERYRFTAAIVARCFDMGLATLDNVPRPEMAKYSELAIKINKIIDYEYRQKNENIETADFKNAKNLSPDYLQAELFLNMRGACSALYAAIETYSEHAILESDSPYLQIRDMLDSVSTVRESVPAVITPRPARKPAWRANTMLFAQWISHALKQVGYAGPLKASNARTPTAAICAQIMNHAYGIDIGAHDIAEAVVTLSQSRLKSSTAPISLGAPLSRRVPQP